MPDLQEFTGRVRFSISIAKFIGIVGNHVAELTLVFERVRFGLPEGVRWEPDLLLKGFQFGW